MIEPQKDIFKKIKLKYRNNKKIIILNHAISDKNMHRNIFINYHDLTSSLTKFNYNNNYLKIKSKIFNTTPHGMIKEKLTIKTIKMSTLLSKKNITNVDLIKIDTEGHELEVLKGMGEKIKIIIYRASSSFNILSFLIDPLISFLNFDLNLSIFSLDIV